MEESSTSKTGETLGGSITATDETTDDPVSSSTSELFCRSCGLPLQSTNFGGREEYTFDLEVTDTGCELCPIVTNALVAFTTTGLGNNQKSGLLRVEATSLILHQDNLGTFKVFRSDDSSPAMQATEKSTSWLSIILPSLPRMPFDTASSQSIQVIKHWLAQCERAHSQCAQDDITFMPKRVLEVGEDTVYLREGVPVGEKYACLSHCWGAAGLPIRTTHATITSHKLGIKLTSLPRTFHDAAIVCMNLNIKYLWIDALCIIQEDPTDWREQAAMMASIYTHAYLTIAAAHAIDTSIGLFSPPNPSLQPIHLAKHGLHVKRWAHVAWESAPEEYLPLFKRAWVFQERMLSKRMLHFVGDQLIYRCRTQTISADGLINHPTFDTDILLPDRTISPAASAPTNVQKRWNHLISRYTALSITFPTDRLPAVSALASRLSPHRANDKYIAGMWRATLLQDLDWFIVFSPGSRPTPSLAPTWSWASTQGQVVFAVDGTDEEREGEIEEAGAWFTNLLNLTYTTVEPVNLGIIEDARLHLRAPLLSAHYLGLLDGRQEFEIEFQNARVEFVKPDFDYASGDRPVSEKDEVVIMVLRTFTISDDDLDATGLILRKLDSGMYERIGHTTVNFRLEMEDGGFDEERDGEEDDAVVGSHGNENDGKRDFEDLSDKGEDAEDYEGQSDSTRQNGSDGQTAQELLALLHSIPKQDIIII